MFCTLPVTVAEAASLLSRVKNFLRTTMDKKRLTNLGVSALENDLTNHMDFDALTNDLATKKARKVLV